MSSSAQNASTASASAAQPAASSADRRQTNAPSAGPPTGIVRPRRRVIKNTRDSVMRDQHVVRNYAVADTVLFTNFQEVKNDMISPTYAQDIIEEFMTISNLDMSNSNATKMAEDIIFTFYVENGASVKTSYEKVFDVYGVELDLVLLLQILVSHEITPRRFTRALAGRIHSFLRSPDNEALRVDLVSRHNLDDKDDALICFDGSTHIPNISSAQRSKANMMASRGIYENTASVLNADQRSTYESSLNKKNMNSGALHLAGQD